MNTNMKIGELEIENARLKMDVRKLVQSYMDKTGLLPTIEVSESLVDTETGPMIDGFEVYVLTVIQ